MLSALVLVSAIVAQDPGPSPAPRAGSPDRAAQTGPFDQTVAVKKGTRIDLTECAGDVVVKTWEKDAVRVQSTSGRRAQVGATLTGQVLVISASSTSRVPPLVDFDLTVPAWIDLHIEGRECGIDVTGVAGNVIARNADGDIVLRGLNGAVDAASIDGRVTIDGGRGHIKASSVDAGITITRATGDIEAESVDGDVTLTDVHASAIDASTVDGKVVFSGPIQASGTYRFSTHDGDVILDIPENSSATFAIRMYEGQLHSALPLKMSGDLRRGKRVTYTIGSGSAQVAVETFDGDVHIRKAGTGG